jgi:hypothetical protein
MESRLVKLKSDFNNIITVRNSVKNIFDILQVRIDKLKLFYKEFIKNNKTEMFVFGLDSFHFQNKLIDIEYDDMKRLFLAINNRMYCEYFKLNKIIVEYIIKNINDTKIIDIVKVANFPVYKDLEPYKEYRFEYILEIHENILNLLGLLMSTLNNKENELSMHITKKNIGLNIDNFITSFGYNITVMREKIIMFITYVEFFHNLHTKNLKRFSNKIHLMYSHISNDIKFDDSEENNKNKKKQILEDFNSENIENELIKEIKISIGSETNSEDNHQEENYTKENNIVINYNLDSQDLESDDSLNKKTIISGLAEQLRTRSNSLLSIVNTPTSQNIKNLKKSFKENINVVADMFQLCKTKEDSVIDTSSLSDSLSNSLSNDDIKDIFSTIENSCDLIIEEKSVLVEEQNEGYVEEPLEAKVEEPLEHTVEEQNSADIEEPIESIVEEQNSADIEEPIESIVEELIESIVEEPKKDKKKKKKKKK